VEKITILGLLRKYEEWVKKGQIQFLEKGSEKQKNILNLVNKLISDFKSATEKPGDFSENLNWYKTHQNGRDLWQKLASCALNSIDKESQGNSKLFEFLDAATDFEELLYGLEPYYRDHTLHSLWVYFIGEHLLRDLMPEIHKDLNWYLYNDIELDKSMSPSLVKDSRKKERELCKKINEYRDAIWCLIALCHDLGYSLAKLDKLNEKVEDVLKFFELPDFRRIGYSLDIEHQYNVTQFLELMAMEVRIVPGRDNKKEVLIKCYRDDPTYWLLCRALEKKQHGILSSYLIYKMLGLFGDTSIRGAAEEWGLDDDEAVGNVIYGDILYAIAQHEFDFAYVYELNSLADILIISDELEEFSRYGREMLSREYHDTIAESRISISPKMPKQTDGIEIDILYEVEKHQDLNPFFERKAERLCKIYSLKQNQDEGKFCSIKRIKITATQESEKLAFHLCRDTKNKVYLPKMKFRDKTYKQGEYDLNFRDDKLYVGIKDNEISLKEWFENVVR